MEIVQLFLLFKKICINISPFFKAEVLFACFVHCSSLSVGYIKVANERFYKPPLHIFTHERLGTLLPAARSLPKICKSSVFIHAFKIKVTSNELL